MVSRLNNRLVDIDKYINRAFDEFVDSLSRFSLSDISDWVLGAARSYSLGPGKRIRGSLAMEAYTDLIGSKDANAEVAGYLAAAIELMHNYLLIIDDAMDKSPMRRGLPTVHELYKTDFSAINPSRFEADFVAVNVSIVTQHVASLAIAQAESLAGVPSGTLALVMHRYICLTDLGQVDDLTSSVNRPDSPEKTLERYRKKSSYYSFVNPLACALSLAGKLDNKSLAQITAYGLPAGIAFQLRDDWLGIFGDSAESGKLNLDDIQEGKNTFLVQMAMARADHNERSTLLRILGKQNAGLSELMAVREIMTSTGAVDTADKLMKSMADEAVNAASAIDCFSEEFVRLLKEVVIYTMERKK